MQTIPLRGVRPLGYSDPWLVVAHPSFQPLVDDLVAALPPGAAEVSATTWDRFPDGTPNIFIDARQVQGRDVLLVCPLDITDLLPFFSVAYALPRYLARTLTIVVPFFPTGTMERVAREGEVATAKTLTRMLSSTPSPSVGEANIIIFDIHALAMRFFFKDTVKPVLLSAVPRFIHRLRQDPQLPVVVFPDEGAKKRFAVYFDDFDVAVCVKTREGEKRVLRLTEGAVAGRPAVIVDDLVMTGGTLLQCAELLLAAGSTAVSVYVTHGVFPRESWRQFTDTARRAAGKVPLQRFFVTDSVPGSAAAVRGTSPFEVLSLAASLADHLRPPASGASKL